MDIHANRFTASPDMTSPAGSGRHLWKFEKMAENAASYGFGLIFISALFYLPPPIHFGGQGFLSYLL